MITLKNENVVLTSHKFSTLPDDDLVTFFNDKKRANVLHIYHSFYVAPDRKSYYIWYKKGKLFKKGSSLDYKIFPEPIIYLKEFLFTVRIIITSGITWDLYIGLDGLCVTFGNFLRSIGYVRKTTLWAIDFVDKDRFKSHWKNAIYNSINNKSYVSSDEVWDLSPRMAPGRKKYFNISENGYKKKKIVPYGIWLKRIKHISAKDCEKNTLVFMGNISKYQGVQFVIDAIPDIIKKNNKFVFKIIGKGDYSEELKALVKKKKIEKYCKFLGKIPDIKDLEREIAKSTVAIAPYLHDMTSISYYADSGKVKTYLACGVPVLLTDVLWNSEEIQKNKCGMIINKKKDFVEKLFYLFNSSHNDTYRKNAIRYAKSFDYGTIFSQLDL